MAIAWLLCAVLALPLPLPPPAPGSRLPVPGSDQDLLDRTLAIVGGQPITLSDARAAVALGLIAPPAGGDPAEAIAPLVDRELVLREVQRYAPPAPADGEIDRGVDEVRRRAGGEEALARILEQHGFTDLRLRAWVRDDLRTQAYLAQRFASASLPSDGEVAAAYQRQRAAFDAKGLTFAQAEPEMREQLIAERRAELITDWVSELRRRTEVILFSSQ